LDYLTTHTSLSPIWCGFAPGFVNNKKGCPRLAATSDKVYQLLAHGRWFSPGIPASSTTKTGRRDIAEILLKVTLNTITVPKKSINRPQKTIKKSGVKTPKIKNKSCTEMYILIKLLIKPEA